VHQGVDLAVDLLLGVDVFAGEDISWFEEDKWTLAKRVEQIQTGVHWAEVPLSRVCHMVSNVRLLEVLPSLIGKRTDTLRKVSGSWKLARREILLDQSVLLAKNLTVFL
jgi:3-phenylpropionate/cinnamic acid dioxygenase small subunit